LSGRSTKPRASLTTRVLLVLCVATIVPTVVVGALAIRNATHDVEREVVRGNLALIRSLGALLDARLQDTRRAIETAAGWWAYDQVPAPEATVDASPEGTIEATPEGTIEATIEATPEGTIDATIDATAGTVDSSTERHLARMKREIPLIATVTIVGPEGKRLHGDPVPADVDLGRLTFGGYISDVVFEDGRPRVRVVIQARNRTGELVGAFIAGLDLAFVADTLQMLVKESRLGKGVELHVVDGEGRPVARSGGAPSPRGSQRAVAGALASPGEGSVESGGVIAVYRNLASFQTERGVRWALILEQPTEHAYALAKKTMRDTIITGLVVITLSLIVGMFLAARLTRPLRHLAQRADAVAGDGDPEDAPPAPVDAPGEIGALAMRFEDMARRVSEREKLQSALARGDRLASVGTMAASVAHEINNPLTTVLGYAKLLLENKSAEHPDRTGLELIAEEAARMKSIVGNLLDYSRSERAPRTAESARADVNATLRHTADLLVPQLRGMGVRLDMDLADDLPECAADVHALQQVFVNLVQNAAQAMPGGGTVTIDSRRAPGNVAVQVCVTDQGEGIAKQDRHRVFEPFFTTKEAGTGTGLGLAVCKHLITSAGGTIDVSDGPEGQGARFRVVIPAA
jgi:signal transduction histidine kinase